MSKEGLKETFDNCAAEYDELISKIIPFYHLQNDVILSHIQCLKNNKLHLLDLGIGTGVLSEMILKIFPNSSLLGVDFSEKMIAICDKRLSGHSGRYRLIREDISKVHLDNNFDIAISGLVIHHLEDIQKQQLFQKIYKHLNKGGLFIIRDLIKSKSEEFERLYNKLWCEFERENGLDPEKLKEASYQDRPTTIENHLEWLTQSGFANVDCAWKYNNFAVIMAYK